MPAFLFWHYRDFFPCQFWDGLHIFCFHKGRSHILWYWVILWCEWYTTISTPEIYYSKWVLTHTSLDFGKSVQCTYFYVEKLHSFYVVFPLYFSKHNLRMYDCVEQINNAIPRSVSWFPCYPKISYKWQTGWLILPWILRCTIVEQDRNLAWNWFFFALWLLRISCINCTGKNWSFRKFVLQKPVRASTIFFYKSCLKLKWRTRVQHKAYALDQIELPGHTHPIPKKRQLLTTSP